MAPSNSRGREPAPENLPCLEQGFANGDQKAYVNLWQLYESRLKQCALGFAGGNREVAEEALDKLQVRLTELLNAHSYNPRHRWLAWVTAILLNLIRTEFRNRYREHGMRTTAGERDC